jgi:hypothetical protein
MWLIDCLKHPWHVVCRTIKGAIVGLTGSTLYVLYCIHQNLPNSFPSIIPKLDPTTASVDLSLQTSQLRDILMAILTNSDNLASDMPINVNNIAVIPPEVTIEIIDMQNVTGPLLKGATWMSVLGFSLGACETLYKIIKARNHQRRKNDFDADPLPVPDLNRSTSLLLPV